MPRFALIPGMARSVELGTASLFDAEGWREGVALSTPYTDALVASGIVEVVDSAAVPPGSAWRQPVVAEGGPGDTIDEGETLVSRNGRWLPEPPVNMRAVRQPTGSIAGGASADVVATFDSPFADANYTVSALAEEIGGGLAAATLEVRRVLARNAADVHLRVINHDSLNARSGLVHVIAIHD